MEIFKSEFEKKYRLLESFFEKEYLINKKNSYRMESNKDKVLQLQKLILTISKGKLKNLVRSQEKRTELAQEIAKLSDTLEYIYVLFNPKTKLFKIGKTTNSIKYRMAQITSQSGIEMILAVHCEITLLDDCCAYFESVLHRFFKSKRHIGEWFDLDESDLHALSWVLDEQDLTVHVNKKIFENFDKISTIEFESKYKKSSKKINSGGSRRMNLSEVDIIDAYSLVDLYDFYYKVQYFFDRKEIKL